MNDFEIEAYQFFSRAPFPIGRNWGLNSSSAKRPDLKLFLDYEHVLKPFEMVFAQLRPQRQSIGSHQPIDPELDSYFSQRWPVCLAVKGTIQWPEGEDNPTNEIRTDILRLLQDHLWKIPGGGPDPETPEIPVDQRATKLGYRRKFVHSQLFDILGNRRPSDINSFAGTDIGEPIGPGVATLNGLRNKGMNLVNELVWSPILSFPNRTSIENDKYGIRDALNALQRHYNSYRELRDSRRLLENSEIIAAVRSAASAVDACVKYIRQAARLGNPPSNLQFDEKIEDALSSAGLPSYSAIEPSHSKQLLYLYRARNSMHEGACEYQNDKGVMVPVRDIQQATVFVESAEAFIMWADSLV